MSRILAPMAAIALLAGAAPAMAGEVVITITDMRSTKGVVRACMTAKESIFPKCRKDQASHRTVVPAGETVTIRFRNVVPGDYAVALLHDENNDGKANRALGMMPKEGYGFSRDAKVQMAPPKFEEAVFRHDGGDQKITIRMRYFL
ncbi:MAG: DUF2141 domain-containing protein [Erythrobacter sp.]|nr:DUF2141 domain-containing protein [Erythrobacter sp.]